MPHRSASVALAAVLCCAAGVARSQNQPSPPPGPSTTVAPVTVEAAPKPKVVEKQSRRFVEGYAAAPNAEIDQIGRWHDAVCVQVEGLVPEQAARVKARIEDVARAVGLPKPWGGANCKANVEIVFSGEPQHVLDVVAQRREYLLGYYHRHDRDRLKTVTHPIQAWYVTATQGGAGADIAGLLFGVPGQTGATPTFQTKTEVIDDPENSPPAGCGADHIHTACLRSKFVNVFMVADSKALEGKDLGLVADYMVMLALSQPRSLDGCTPLPSVIDLLAKTACPGREAPDGLTPGDAAYLTALYASDPQARKSGEESDIALRMARILVKANAGAR